MEKFNTFNLRTKKTAKTKIHILHAFLELLDSNRLDEIKVESICSRVDISVKTFFNYFEKKEHLLSYFVQLHAYEMGFISSHYINQTQKPLDAIREIFKQTAQSLEKKPNIMLELISLQTKSDISCGYDISDAEKLYFFQNIPDIENYKDSGFDTLIPALLQEAQKLQQLKSSTDIQRLYLELMSLFYGSSILILRSEPQHYCDQLDAMIAHALEVHSNTKKD